MKKIICVLIFLSLVCFRPICEGGWINEATMKEFTNVPKQWTFSNGSKTGNFRDMSQVKKNAEGWYEVEDISPTLDPDIEDAGVWTYEKVGTLYKKNRVIFDKDTNIIKKDLGGRIKAQGIALFKAKWDMEQRSLGFYTTQEEADMDADKSAFKAYFGTIRTAIIDATTGSEVKAIMTGVTWPDI